MRATCATIHIGALRENLRRVRELAPGARVLAVVKADGYGHGLERVARALAGADAFGVAGIADGQRLRAAGVSQRIVVLSGLDEAGDLAEMRRLRLDTVVHNEEQVAALAADRDPRPLRVWLKLDTGMHRLGFAPERAREVHARLRALACVDRAIVLMTHFANSDVFDDNLTGQQIDRFEAAVSGLDGERSLSNSAGVLGWPEAQGDWVRTGGALYGISVVAGKIGADFGFQPAMTLETRLVAVNRVRRGERIGYGGDLAGARRHGCRRRRNRLWRRLSAACRRGHAGTRQRTPCGPRRPRVDGPGHDRPARPSRSARRRHGRALGPRPAGRGDRGARRYDRLRTHLRSHPARALRRGRDLMAKARTAYVCGECGAEHNKWQGQCAECGVWNTLTEFVVQPAAKSAAANPRGGYAGVVDAPKVTPLAAVALDAEQRGATGIGELDRVLGGGLVAGSVVLIGGDPGIGKSTLLLQMLGAIGGRLRGLYVTGEESLGQVASRALRLGIALDGLRSACRNLDRTHPRRDRGDPSRCADHRFDPDDLDRVADRGARFGIARYASRPHASCVSQRKPAPACSWSAT